MLETVRYPFHSLRQCDRGIKETYPWDIGPLTGDAAPALRNQVLFGDDPTNFLRPILADKSSQRVALEGLIFRSEIVFTYALQNVTQHCFPIRLTAQIGQGGRQYYFFGKRRHATDPAERSRAGDYRPPLRAGAGRLKGSRTTIHSVPASPRIAVSVTRSGNRGSEGKRPNEDGEIISRRSVTGG